MNSNNKHVTHVYCCCSSLSHMFIVVLHLSVMCLLLLFISQSHVYCCSSSLSHMFIVVLHLSVTCLLLFFISQSHVYCCSSSLSHMKNNKHMTERWRATINTWLKMKSNNKHVSERWRTTINTWLKMKSNNTHMTEDVVLHLSETCLLLLFISQSHVYCCSSSLSHMFIVVLHLQSHNYCCHVSERWRTTINTWLKMKSNNTHMTEDEEQQ
jgi:ribosomal protein L35